MPRVAQPGSSCRCFAREADDDETTAIVDGSWLKAKAPDAPHELLVSAGQVGGRWGDGLDHSNLRSRLWATDARAPGDPR